MRKEERGITWRSVLLGLSLSGGLVALTPYNDFVVGNTYIAGNHFPVAAVAVLLLLALLNLAIHRARGRAWLTAREIAVVYILILVPSGIPHAGLLSLLIPGLTTPYYYASPGNQWEALFWGYLPEWMTVSREEAVKWFWEGTPAGSAIPWGQWLGPLSRWSILVVAMWVAMICLTALVRKQWTDRERLSFPLVQFPVEVLSEGRGGPSAAFFGSGLVWLGTGAVFVLHFINGLHAHFPSFPQIPTFWNLNTMLVERPWSGAYPLWLGIFPSAIGFGYLLPLEVSAGFWGGVLFLKAQGILLNLFGYEGNVWGGVVRDVGQHEEMGGLLMISVVLLWLLRSTMRDVLRKAFGRAREVDDSREPLSYRAAFFGLIGSLGVALGWLVAAGMSPLFAAAYLVIAVCLFLVVTRIVAEAGLMLVDLGFGADHYLQMLGNTTALGPDNLTALTLVNAVFTWDLREFLMPSALNGFRLAEQSGISTRKLTPAIGAAIGSCFLISLPAFLLPMYKVGAAQMPNVQDLIHPRRFFGALATQLQNPESPSGIAYLSLGIGGGLVAALSWLRLNYVWWPVHPLGFVMGDSWASMQLWFSLFLGWLFKLLTIRYTGLRGYLVVRPLFMGVIMGDILGAVFWIAVASFTKVSFMVTVM
jgi:hypothetical protein